MTLRDQSATRVIPERSLAQRMDALALATEVRSRNSQIKRDLTAGNLTLDEALASEMIGSCPVFALVMAVPKVGKSKTNAILSQLGISPTKRVGQLTDRQRLGLVRWSGGRAS